VPKMFKAKQITIGSLAIALTTVMASAQTTPLTITLGFNQDLVADGSFALPSTTSTIDGSSVFYDSSYAASNGISGGIFPAGSTVTGNDGNQYTFASAMGDNGLLLDDGSESGSLSFTPTGLSTLDLLGMSANGGVSGGVTVSYTLNFANATTASGTAFFQDWYDESETLGTITGLQRVNQASDFYDSTHFFSLFSVAIAIPIADQSLALDSVTLTSDGISGSSVAVFAADGTAAPVPEPTSLVLAAAGVGLLAVLRRRS